MGWYGVVWEYVGYGVGMGCYGAVWDGMGC